MTNPPISEAQSTPDKEENTRPPEPLCESHPAWYFGGSDQGLVRENNEDRFSLDGERNLFLVADGMGGHAAGEVASLVATESLQQSLTSEVIAAAVPFDLKQEITAALREANAAVIRASTERFEWSGMGSTAVIALLHARALYVANVGDSRAYLLRAGVMQMLSQDHSVAAALADQNHIARDEVRTHPLRNRLTVCLGIEERIEPYTSRILIQPGDRVMLCSDGLWDMLPDEEITAVWNKHTAAKEAVQALIAAANLAGGQDNITVVALNIDEHAGFSASNDYTAVSSVAASLDDTVVVAC